MSSRHSHRNPMVASRHSSPATPDGPLTAERAMLDQIRSKLERTQRRLARTASSSSSGYLPPDSSSRALSSNSVAPVTVASHQAPSRSRRPQHHHSMQTGHHSGSPLPHQYKSKSKFAHVDIDPLNGGPPPLSTPYLVYSNSRPPCTASHGSEVKSRVWDDPHSSLRPRVARAPTSRVRFQGYEDTRESHESLEGNSGTDSRQRREQQRHERETRHVQQMQQTRASATATRHSVAREKLPNSAINPLAYQEVESTRTMPQRRSVDTVPPPLSDIKVSALDEFRPRRRSGEQQHGTTRATTQPVQQLQQLQQLQHEQQVQQGTDRVLDTGDKLAVEYATDRDDDDTSTYETDDSCDIDSESEFLTTSEYARVVPQVKLQTWSGNATDTETTSRDTEDEDASRSRVTTKDLALYALGRTSNCSELGSPVPSNAATITRAPVSYTPAFSAFPVARAPKPSGTRHSGVNSANDVATYVRRSRPRAPMDLKNHLPPSIGVLSGLSSGSSTFVLDPTSFYTVAWTAGEFAFSVQPIFTATEFEFDDCAQERLFLRMLLDTERSTCAGFDKVRLGDVLIRVGDVDVADLGLEGSGSVLTKFFAKMMAQLPVQLTFQRMKASDWEGGVEL